MTIFVLLILGKGVKAAMKKELLYIGLFIILVVAIGMIIEFKKAKSSNESVPIPTDMPMASTNGASSSAGPVSDSPADVLRLIVERVKQGRPTEAEQYITENGKQWTWMGVQGVHNVIVQSLNWQSNNVHYEILYDQVQQFASDAWIPLKQVEGPKVSYPKIHMVNRGDGWKLEGIKFVD